MGIENEVHSERELLAGSVKLIRKALSFKVTPVFASVMPEVHALMKAMNRPTTFRIQSARMRRGCLEVQSVGGAWFVPNEIWRERK